MRQNTIEGVLVASKDIPPIRIDYYYSPNGKFFKQVVIPNGGLDGVADWVLVHRRPCKPYNPSREPVIYFREKN